MTCLLPALPLSSQEADSRVLARAASQTDPPTGGSQRVSHDLKVPNSVPSEQRSSGEVCVKGMGICMYACIRELQYQNVPVPQGMEQSELESNASFPITPVRIAAGLADEVLHKSSSLSSSLPPSPLPSSHERTPSSASSGSSAWPNPTTPRPPQMPSAV